MAWKGGQPRRVAWRALYECVRVSNEPCRVAVVNDFLVQDLYKVWAAASDEAVQKLKSLPEPAADERYEHTELRMLRLRTDTFAGPTPETIPGVKEVGTRSLLAMIRSAESATLLDVWCADGTLPFAKCVFGAGLAFIDPARDEAHEKLFLKLLDAMVPGRQGPIVVFSIHSNNWLSANAAFRAAKTGRNVFWYRGGVDAWKAAGLPLVPTAPVGAVTE